ncbi:MAG: hypothetical protein IJ228_11355 [Succinivibrio sp.]|nr:hypothetical protein [Succinivibrio sp.]
MDKIEHLNTVIREQGLQLGEFDPKTGMSVSMAGTVPLYMYAGPDNIMFFMGVTTIDERILQQKPDLYRELLIAGSLGGDFGNVRIVLDAATDMLWLCRSAAIEPSELKDEAADFSEQAAPLRRILLKQMLSDDYEPPNAVSQIAAAEEFAAQPAGALLGWLQI